MSSSILPIDVIETILLRLSAFDLVRCKRVCMAWRSLISSADFVSAHLQRSQSDPSSHQLLVRNRSFDFGRPLTGPFESLICFSCKDLLIVGSVNGLICIAGKGETPFVTPSPDDIWILNPVTGLSKKLPYSSRLSVGTDQYIKFAFWCDNDDDDGGGVYKVAKFSTDFDGMTMFELWDSTSPDTWTEIYTFELDFHLHPRRLHACDVLIEGLAAYWILVDCYDDDDCDGYSSDDELIGYDDEITVVSLDFESLELTKFIPLYNRELRIRKGYLRTALDGNPNSFLFGGNLNGEFVLVTYSFSDRGIYFDQYYDIWTLVMDDTATPGWIKRFTICLDCFPFDECLGIVNDKLVLTRWRDRMLVLCDPLTGMLEVLETDSKVERITKDSACGFVGSLVSMDGFGFEWNDILGKYMGITWPYSLYPSARWKQKKRRIHY